MESSPDRHSRARAAGYDPELLFDSTWLIVGAGAAGENALQDAALSGAGTIVVVDPDVFEDQNRTRSPLFPTASDAAQLRSSGKALVSASKALQLMTAPSPRVGYYEGFVQELGDQIISEADVILSDVDSDSGRAYLAERARVHSKPLVELGFRGHRIRVSAYGPDPNESCWRDGHPERDQAFSCRNYAVRSEAAGFIPAIQTAAATGAAIQVEQAIAILHSEPSLIGKTAWVDLRDITLDVSRQGRSPACPGIHDVYDGTIALDVGRDSAAGRLIDEVISAVGSATIRLPDPVIGAIGCTKCRSIVPGPFPDWQWFRRPFCAKCGGVNESDSDATPWAIGNVIDTAIPDDVRDVPCEALGIVPGVRLPVYPRAGGCLLAIVKPDPVTNVVWLSQGRTGSS